MKLRRSSLIEGARSATGTAVIIDVYRAFTVAAFCLAAGARDVVFVREVEEALALRAADGALFLTGEVGGRPIAGFDVGNSPEAIATLDLGGRRVVQRTGAGTQGVVAASAAAREVVAASLVVAAATARYVRASAAVEVTLVAMGDGVAHEPAAEDEACADYIEDLLFDRAPRRPTGIVMRPGWTDDGWTDWFTRRDIELACDVDRFDFAMPVRREGSLLLARAVVP